MNYFSHYSPSIQNKKALQHQTLHLTLQRPSSASVYFILKHIVSALELQSRMEVEPDRADGDSRADGLFDSGQAFHA